MPSSGKVFIDTEGKGLKDLAAALEGYKVTEEYDDGNTHASLLTNIENLSIEDDKLHGLYSFDAIRTSYHRGRVNAVPYTTECLFELSPMWWKGKHQAKNNLLIVLAKKRVANMVANRLSEIIFGEMGVIVEAILNPVEMKKYYEHSNGTKVCLLKDLTVPNMKKVTLYGDDVVQTDLYGSYILDGQPQYIVAKTAKQGYTVGLSQDGGVTVFSGCDQGQFLYYVRDEVAALILERKEAV